MMIERVVWCSVLYFTLAFANGQSVISDGSIDLREIQPEIEWFVDKTKIDSYEAGKYNVYLVKISGENRLDYCASMEYIKDSLLVSEIEEFKHYIELKGQLVLIQLPSHLSIKNDLNGNAIKPLVDTNLIAKKIYPGTVFLSTPSGYVCCFNNRNIVKIYYDNADEMPYEKRIFKYIPQGESIKVDSSTMKQMFKKKKSN
jgi:hypothetical protein